MNIPSLWIGEHPNYILKNHKKVIDSTVNYYPKNKETIGLKIPYTYEKLFLDNGAYAALYQNINLERDVVMDIQEEFDPDLTIPLDFPYLPGMPKEIMKNRWEKTKDNILYWMETSSLAIVPPLHVIGGKMLVSSVNWLQSNCDSDFVAVGSVITCYTSNTIINEKFKGYFGDRHLSKQLVETLLFVGQIIQKFSDFKTHIMGFGSSPLTYHLGVYCGVHSTDSSGHRRKAAYGNIVLPGTATRYICDRDYKFDNKRPDEEEEKKLAECMCPVCVNEPPDAKARLEKLASHWKLRAIHNMWVMEYEEKRAGDLLNKGEDVYEAFLEDMYRKSGLYYLWRYAKKMKNQLRVECWVTK